MPYLQPRDSIARSPHRFLGVGVVLAVLRLSSGPAALRFVAVPKLCRSLYPRRWTASSVARHADASPSGGAVSAVPSMSEADVFMTETDVITGEIDVSGLPQGMGVYAVFDTESRLQYIGLSKQISKSVEGHAEIIGLQEASALIASVKCTELPGQSKETLKATWERWIKEHMESGGEIPAGNLPETAPGADRRWRTRSQGRQPLSLAGVRGITSMAEALEAVRGAVERHPVLLFMKGTPAMPQCGFSARSVGIMGSLGVPFDTVNVLDGAANPGVREAVKQHSGWPTIPQLFLRGELLGGADIIAELHASGQLEGLLRGEAAGAGGAAGAAGAGGAGAAAAAGPGGALVELVEDAARPVASQMSRVLSEAFELHSLRILDESAEHEGDVGALEMGLTGESHFRLELAAPEFEGLTPVQRQQRVFDALAEVMPRIHALSLVTRTPAEAS